MAEPKRDKRRGAFNKRVAGAVTAAFFYLDSRVSAVLRRGDEATALRRAQFLVPILAAALAQQRRRNYRLLLPELNEDAMRSLLRRHLAYLAQLQTHNARLAIETPDMFAKKVKVHGEENLHAARAAGRGLLLVAAHTGTWWHIIAALVARRLQPTAFANAALGRISGYMQKLCDRFEVPLVFVGRDAYEQARTRFRRGGTIYLTVDVTVRPEQSRWVPLGPAEILIDPGPALMAARQRVPLMWARSFHSENGESHVEFTPTMDVAAMKPDDVMRWLMAQLWRDLQLNPAQWWAANFVTLRPAQRVAAAT